MSVVVQRSVFDQGEIAFAWSHAPVRNPLVTLHGLGDSSILTYAPIFASTVLQNTPSLFVDLPGFGLSRANADFTASLENYASLMVDFFRTLGIKSISLFGHSMGGSIAILIAHVAPDLVRSLIVAEPLLVPANSVLANSIAKRPEATFVEHGYDMLVRATQRQAFRHDIVAKEFLAPLRMANPRIVHQAATSLVSKRHPTLEVLMADLTCERTLLVGEHTPADTRLLQASGVHINRIPNAGHGMMVESPDVVAHGILDANY